MIDSGKHSYNDQFIQIYYCLIGLENTKEKVYKCLLKTHGCCDFYHTFFPFVKSFKKCQISCRESMESSIREMLYSASQNKVYVEK